MVDAGEKGTKDGITMEQESIRVVDLETIRAGKSGAKPSLITKTRKDLQLGRRFFHMSMGVVVASAYAVLLTHKQLVYILGTSACVLYLLEQIRINYPEFATHFNRITKYLLRAEEQLKESAMIPYSIALLLTILSFPKLVALTAIYTLAIADPLSALVGIRFGKNQIVKNKSVEGSIAFFIATFLCTLLPFLSTFDAMDGIIWLVSFILALGVTIFEMAPIKIDDNLTIPLFTAFLLVGLCWLFNIPVF